MSLSPPVPVGRFYYSFPYALFFVCLFNEAALLFGYAAITGYG